MSFWLKGNDWLCAVPLVLSVLSIECITITAVLSDICIERLGIRKGDDVSRFGWKIVSMKIELGE